MPSGILSKSSGCSMDVLANNSAKFGNIHNPPLEIKDFTAVGKEWAYFRYSLFPVISAI